MSKVFPNPNNGEFYVELLNFGSLTKQIQLIDITGKIVSNQTTSCENCTLSYQKYLQDLFSIN